jgi:hypothetical protein
MAVSSATSSSNIDVAGIVEQLMTVENRPLDAKSKDYPAKYGN